MAVRKCGTCDSHEGRKAGEGTGFETAGGFRQREGQRLRSRRGDGRPHPQQATCKLFLGMSKDGHSDITVEAPKASDFFDLARLNKWATRFPFLEQSWGAAVSFLFLFSGSTAVFVLYFCLQKRID